YLICTKYFDLRVKFCSGGYINGTQSEELSPASPFSCYRYISKTKLRKVSKHRASELQKYILHYQETNKIRTCKTFNSSQMCVKITGVKLMTIDTIYKKEDVVTFNQSLQITISSFLRPFKACCSFCCALYMNLAETQT
ncbi:Hypothetical predicted protein, partial [Mytilus galloprovincialis]